MTDQDGEWSDLREEAWALFVGYRHWLAGPSPTEHTAAIAAVTWARVDGLVARTEAVLTAARAVVADAGFNDGDNRWNGTWAVADERFAALRAALAAWEETE